MILKRSLLYSVLLITLLLVCVAHRASAFNVLLEPETVHPGDVFLIKTDAGERPSAEAEFLRKPIRFHAVEKGAFIAIIPVDVNTVPKDYPVSISRGAEQVTATIQVTPREVRTIHLTVSEEKVTLSPEDQQRVDREYQLQEKIWDRLTPPVWNSRFSEPTGTEPSTEFGVKRIFNKKRTSIHRGMDFRGKTGAPVRAINAGTVVLSQELFYGGNTLVIDHGMGLYSVYMHMSAFSVREGETVVREQVIGSVGSTGRVTGPHLHLSVKLNGVSVDPESLFKLEL